MKALLLLAVSAVVLSSPLPPSRRASGITVEYSSNYPNGPSFDPSAGAVDALDNKENPSTTERELDQILSLQRPLPSTFLLAVPALRKGSSPQHEESSHEEESFAWAGDVKYFCPFVAMLAFSLLGLLACAIQRCRNARGIYLPIETPNRQSLSLRAEGEEKSTDERVLVENDSVEKPL